MGRDLGTTTREATTRLRRGGLRVATGLARFRGFDVIATPRALLRGNVPSLVRVELPLAERAARRRANG
jgi:hypothetical protein